MMLSRGICSSESSIRGAKALLNQKQNQSAISSEGFLQFHHSEQCGFLPHLRDTAANRIIANRC